jgi:hypothetical protein
VGRGAGGNNAEKAADASIEFAAEETLDDGSDLMVYMYDEIGNAGDEDDFCDIYQQLLVPMA